MAGPLDIRPAAAEDAPALTAILNAHVAGGTTTAIGERLTPPVFAHWFIDGPEALGALTAWEAEAAAGFQALERGASAAEAEIATFAAPKALRRGVGRALMEATRARARALGFTALVATIRADNAGGLAFYRAMEFRPWEIRRAVPLADGRLVDRVRLRLTLA